MMTKITGIFWMFILVLTANAGLQAQDLSGAEKLGWEVGSQAYTFRLFTLEETLDKLNDLDLKYVEMYPGQKIWKDSEATTDYKMGSADREKLKDLLSSKGITATAYGVVVPRNEADWNSLFEFAEDLGIGVITSEPDYGQLDLVESLCEKYNIRLAFHNHPIPSKYWHPDISMTLLEGRSPLIGVCADVGHWVRSGLDPIECLKKTEGRVISSHFKDLNEFGVRSAHDVPWGTGVSNVAGILHEMKRQGFQGPISVEYEHNWENNVPDIRESLEYFGRVANSLTK